MSHLVTRLLPPLTPLTTKYLTPSPLPERYYEYLLRGPSIVMESYF
jgi:hypothetical protein